MTSTWLRSLPRLLCTASLAVVLPYAIGCGGGAADDTDVTYVPTTREAPAESGGGTTPQANGAGGGSQTEETVVTEGVGNFIGRVVFEGSAPDLSPLAEAGADIKDAAICSAAPIPNQRFVIGADNGVANVFVYLKKAPKGAKFSDPTEPAIFDQKGCVFNPHCLVLRTGQEMLVKSDDAIAHNTHVYAQRNNQESKLIPANNREGIPFTYRRPESVPFEVKCDYHSWMIAYHLPLDHPYAALTDQDGKFTIRDLPAGKYEFVVWHEAAVGNYVHRGFEVTIKPDDDNMTDIPYPSGSLGSVAFNATAPTSPRITISQMVRDAAGLSN